MKFVKLFALPFPYTTQTSFQQHQHLDHTHTYPFNTKVIHNKLTAVLIFYQHSFPGCFKRNYSSQNQCKNYPGVPTVHSRQSFTFLGPVLAERVPEKLMASLHDG